MNDTVTVMKGGLAADDRGHLQFCNGLDMEPVKRFYIVSNHSPRFVRAWHAHKFEGKFVTVASGAAIIAAVKIDHWDTPNKDIEPDRFVVSDKQPDVVWIPPGYANGFMTLEPDTKVLFFSTKAIDDSVADDYRYPADYWNPWTVIER